MRNGGNQNGCPIVLSTGWLPCSALGGADTDAEFRSYHVEMRPLSTGRPRRNRFILRRQPHADGPVVWPPLPGIRSRPRSSTISAVVAIAAPGVAPRRRGGQTHDVGRWVRARMDRSSRGWSTTISPVGTRSHPASTARQSEHCCGRVGGAVRMRRSPPSSRSAVSRCSSFCGEAPVSQTSLPGRQPATATCGSDAPAGSRRLSDSMSPSGLARLDRPSALVHGSLSTDFLGQRLAGKRLLAGGGVAARLPHSAGRRRRRSASSRLAADGTPLPRQPMGEGCCGPLGRGGGGPGADAGNWRHPFQTPIRWSLAPTADAFRGAGGARAASAGFRSRSIRTYGSSSGARPRGLSARASRRWRPMPISSRSAARTSHRCIKPIRGCDSRTVARGRRCGSSCVVTRGADGATGFAERYRCRRAHGERVESGHDTVGAARRIHFQAAAACDRRARAGLAGSERAWRSPPCSVALPSRRAPPRSPARAAVRPAASPQSCPR